MLVSNRWSRISPPRRPRAFPYDDVGPGTRDPKEPWPDAIAHLMAQIDADGINGDTQDGVPLAFFQAAVKIDTRCFQPEGSPHDEAVGYNLLTWVNTKFSVFGLDRFKWLRPAHGEYFRIVGTAIRMMICSSFYGVGWESWENIWGIWNGITPRDAEATDVMATIERAFAPFLSQAGWEPFYQHLLMAFSASRCLFTKPLCGRWSTETNTTVNDTHYRSGAGWST